MLTDHYGELQPVMSSTAPPLTSTRNPRVRAAAALSRGRERRATGRHLAEGPNAVSAAINAGLAETVFVTPDGQRLLAVDDQRVRDGQSMPDVVVVSEAVLDHITDAVTPQPICAVVVTPTADIDRLVSTMDVLVLDAVADPGNVGTLVRTAQAFGFGAVMTTAMSADPFGPKAARSSAGAIYGPAIVTDIDPSAVIEWSRRTGRMLIGLDSRGATPLDAVAHMRAPLTLAVGSEAHGLSSTFIAALDEHVAIPMPGPTESLNAAIAGAIAMYVVMGGRSKGDRPGMR